jgi:hypothetical protein
VSEFNPDLSSAGSSVAPPRPPDREGLPSGYRMRAEEHYVDELMSRRGHGDFPAALDADAATPDVDHAEERHQRVLAQLGDELATIESAAALLDEHGSPLSRRVGIDLIRAQARRAAWLLRAHALTVGTHLPAVRQRTIASLLAEVRDGLAAECRLAGVPLQIQAADLQATVSVDDEAVTAGISAAIMATMGLLTRQEGATLRVTAVAVGGELRTVEVRQDSAPVAPQIRRRFFDPSWTDRPGGWIAALAAETARRVARQAGGEATLLAGDRRGSTLRLTLSRTG